MLSDDGFKMLEDICYRGTPSKITLNDREEALAQLHGVADALRENTRNDTGRIKVT